MCVVVFHCYLVIFLSYVISAHVSFYIFVLQLCVKLCHYYFNSYACICKLWLLLVCCNCSDLFCRCCTFLLFQIILCYIAICCSCLICYVLCSSYFVVSLLANVIVLNFVVFLLWVYLFIRIEFFTFAMAYEHMFLVGCCFFLYFYTSLHVSAIVCHALI